MRTSKISSIFHVKFFFQNSKIRKLSYISSWRLIYPSVTVGVGRSVASRSQVIHSSFSNIFQLKIFPNPKNPESTRKTIRYASFSHRRGRDGVIGCIPILIDSFRFLKYIPCENFLPKLKNSQIKLYIIIKLIYPTVGVGVKPSFASRSQVEIHLSFSNIFQLKIFSQSQKFGKYAKNHKIWLLPKKEWGWGVRLDLDLKLFSGVLGTSVQNFRLPAQSARLWPFLVVIVILFLFLVQ